MTKRRGTKRTLLSSVLALFLCFVMLIGTTYAWFTDSVTSANNIITTGELDLFVEYQKADGSWAEMTAQTNVFEETDLWEPGHTDVVKLRITNAGDLAFKYQLGINVVNETPSVNVNGEEFKLSDYIKYGVVNEDATYSTSAEAATAVDATATALNQAYTSDDAVLVPADKVTATDVNSQIVTIVVYIPTEVGNEANAKVGAAIPTIDLGINVFATQATFEEDAHGTEYDEDAAYPENQIVVSGNATTGTTINDGAASVEIPVGAEGGFYKFETSGVETTTDAAGNTTATMEISLKKDGADVIDNGTEYTVTVNIGAGLNLTKVVHDGVEIPATDYTYDIVTGDVTFKTTHFSPFSFTYNNGADVATLDELLAALATDTRVINLKNDIEASEVVLIGRSVMINGNGYKVTSNATRVFRVTTNDVDVILNDVNMVSTAVRVGTNDVRGISIDIVENVKLTLNNCTVDFTDASANDWAYAVNVTGGANHTVTVNGGAYEGANIINVRSAKSAVTVKNATLTSTYPNTEAYIALNYFGACIWVLKNQGTSVYASGNTYIGDNAVAHNLGVGNFLEEGDNVDNTTSLAVEARIGGAIYDTLADAVAEAKAGDKVVLIRDIVLDETVVIPEDKTITLDLNGKTITAGLKSEGRHHYAIDNYGTVTITGNGTIEARGIQNFGTMTIDGDVTIIDVDTNGGAAVWNEGTLTINNGTFKAVASDSTGGAALINKGGNVTVYGGVFSSEAKLTYAILSQNGGELTINNATVTGVHGCVGGNNTNDSVITVNGGKYTLLDNPGVSDHVLYCVTAVYGGNFKAESLDNGGQIFYESAIADGYEAFENNDGTFIVLPEGV